jgi:hypothetical protein
MRSTLPQKPKTNLLKREVRVVDESARTLKPNTALADEIKERFYAFER